MSAAKSAENTQNAPKIFGPICLAKTKVWAFRKKLSLGVRSPCSSASLVITIYDIRIRPYDLWACTFSLHVQKREGRAVTYCLRRTAAVSATAVTPVTAPRQQCVAGGFNLRPPPPNSVTYVVETYSPPLL